MAMFMTNDPLAFDHQDWRQPRHLARQAGLVHHLDHSIHVLVSLGRFFGQAGHRAGADGDALALQLAPQLVAAHLLFGL